MSTKEAAEQASNSVAAIHDSGFFVLRTPALPMDEFVGWSASLKTRQACQNSTDESAVAEAWTSDLKLLRSRLSQIVDRAEIRHALFIASPSLESSIHYWKQDPESKKGHQAERSLVRYFSRMCGRPTPFGLFAGYSIGRVVPINAGEADLSLDSRGSYRLSCRLDFDYLFALTAALETNPIIAERLRYWTNSSIRKIGDVWHYVESKLVESKRSHHLVKLFCEPVLDAIIESAREGLSIPELVEAAHKLPEGCEFSAEEIRTYISELIGNGVLVSSLSPLVSGQPALDDLINQLEMIPSASEAARRLQGARSRMAALGHIGVCVDPGEYRGIASSLEQLPAKSDLAKLFQVDMIKPAPRLTLPQEVLAELKTAVAILSQVSQSGEHSELRTFRDAFVNRYEHAWVPLEMVLDEESGIGFGSASGADSSPLLRDLGQLGKSARTEGATEDFRLRLKRAHESATESRGVRELVIDISGIPPKLADISLPTAFDMVAVLVAPSIEALRVGDFRIVVKGMAGPSGARLLGRFCHADRDLEACVRNHLHQEEQGDADAVYAEIVHLPEGRLGNVLCRPVLRDYEIVYLGRSGAPRERQLPVSDLLVTVAPDGRILLYSMRLQKRVIPRLTSAHGYFNPTLASVYRFLAFLQHDGAALPYFSWGDLGGLRTLPRVRVGRVVLACAQWQLSVDEVKAIEKEDGRDRFLAMQRLRERRGLPRWVVLTESDNSLPVDLENPLSVDAFIHVLKRSGQGTLTEMYPSPDELCVTSPEGKFCHELLVPFVRSKVDKPADVGATHKDPASNIPITVPRPVRTAPPGGEWLYAKVYAGSATLDEILVNALPTLLQTTSTRNLFSEWFFIRYNDPNFHLRLRFHGKVDSLWSEMFPLLNDVLKSFISSGRVWKMQIDTYEREIERYGGPEGISLSEEIFSADSDAVLEILQSFEGDEGLDIRWRVALLGIDRLYKDFSLDLPARKETAKKMRDSYEREFGVGQIQRKQLGDKFRRERNILSALFGDKGSNPALVPAREVLERRSLRIAGPVQKLRALAASGELKTDLIELVSSYNHLHVNRLLRMEQRAHELVLYDFLYRLYEGELIRRGIENRDVAPDIRSHSATRP